MMFIVNIPNVPTDVSVRALRNYILDAIVSDKGRLHPENPVFDMTFEGTTVVHIEGSEK